MVLHDLDNFEQLLKVLIGHGMLQFTISISLYYKLVLTSIHQYSGLIKSSNFLLQLLIFKRWRNLSVIQSLTPIHFTMEMHS